LASAMSYLVGIAMFGALTFLPLYQQTVQHLSATSSGLMLIPMMLGATTTTVLDFLATGLVFAKLESVIRPMVLRL
jgi:hypothetical protein